MDPDMRAGPAWRLVEAHFHLDASQIHGVIDAPMSHVVAAGQSFHLVTMLTEHWAAKRSPDLEPGHTLQ